MTPELFPRPVFSVTELTRSLRAVIEDQVGSVWVEGEVCNHRRQSSGHQYFTLKDEKCQLGCVLFQRPVLYLRQPVLADGMQVQLHGEMTVYESRGQYQLNVRRVELGGSGLLLAKFEALKKKLQAEGLFETAAKKSLPKFPKAIGIVTSPTGAAIQDMLNVLRRRAPWVRIVISPVRVQGDGAAEEIASAIRQFNRDHRGGEDRGAANRGAEVDLLVICRGGGSAEDLWAFNEEVVARAIYDSQLPLVSAVGHEVDFTIADFVADLRAPTPSAAAELIVPDRMELTRRLAQLELALQRCVSTTVAQTRARVASLAKGTLFKEPWKRLTDATQRVDWAAEELGTALRHSLERRKTVLSTAAAKLQRFRPDHLLALKRHRLATMSAAISDSWKRQMSTKRETVAQLNSMLRVLSPEGTLERGYTITTTPNGRLLRSATDAPPGTKLVTHWWDGKAASVVKPK